MAPTPPPPPSTSASNRISNTSIHGNNPSGEASSFLASSSSFLLSNIFIEHWKKESEVEMKAYLESSAAVSSKSSFVMSGKSNHDEAEVKRASVLSNIAKTVLNQRDSFSSLKASGSLPSPAGMTDPSEHSHHSLSTRSDDRGHSDRDHSHQPPQQPHQRNPSYNSNSSTGSSRNPSLHGPPTSGSAAVLNAGVGIGDSHHQYSHSHSGSNNERRNNREMIYDDRDLPSLDGASSSVAPLTTTGSRPPSPTGSVRSTTSSRRERGERRPSSGSATAAAAAAGLGKNYYRTETGGLQSILPVDLSSDQLNELTKLSIQRAKIISEQTKVAGSGAWKSLLEIERYFSLSFSFLRSFFLSFFPSFLPAFSFCLPPVLSLVRLIEMLTLGAYYKYSSTAFVTFQNRVTESIAQQMLLSPDAMEINHAPNPKDIIWENVAIPKRQIEMRRFVTISCFSFLVTPCLPFLLFLFVSSTSSLDI
jgi:hypothetical protein